MRQPKIQQPTIQASSKERACIERALEILAKDTKLAPNGRDPWAYWFVCKYVTVIRVSKLPGRTVGRAISWGQILLDSSIFVDDDWTYLDIAKLILHEATHQWWTKNCGTRRNSEEEESDCKATELRFARRVTQLL